MKKLHLTMATDYYEIMEPLIEGRVEPEGIDLTVLLDGRERATSVDRSLDVDMGVFTIYGYMWMHDQGMPWVALPIFPQRRFRHGAIFINTTKGIKKPSDLAGKRVGGDFGGAVGRWMRGTLDEHYGVPQESITWVVNPGYGTDKSRGIPHNDRAKLKLEVAPAGTTVEDMILEGKIDATISTDFLPKGFREGDPRIARLFPNFREEEAALYKRTGVFPIQQGFKIKREIVEEHPWVAVSICKALNEAKRIAYQRLRAPRTLPFIHYESLWEEQEALMGKDPWAYGLTPQNRKSFETAVRYAYRQGLISKEYPVDELFFKVDESVFAG